MQTKISVILNEIFKYIVLFLFFFIWINYYYPNFLLSVVFAVLLCSITSYFLTNIFYKKQMTYNNTEQEKKQIKQITTQFIFNNLNINLQFFKKVFDAKNVPNNVDDYAIILYPSTAKSILVLLNFANDETNPNFIVNTYKQAQIYNCKKILILKNKSSVTANNFANTIDDVNITVFNDSDIFNQLLKPNNVYPKLTVKFKKQSKMNISLFLTMLLNKKNAKHYFWGGIMLIFVSSFIRLGLYYIISATIFLMLALFSFYSDQIFTKANKSIFN
jgi:hypothetical protein